MRSKYINPFTDYGFKKLFGEEGKEEEKEKSRLNDVERVLKLLKKI
jgi:hypothetical protein